MKELCVVHLIRARNGIEPFCKFLDSYRQNPGGVEHDLLIVFKGFKHPQDTKEYRALLAPIGHLTLDISDEGFDITAYFAAVDRYSEQYRLFCFLNSYSVIQDGEWLKKLYQNISQPGVGLVGATGCWNSNNTNAHAWFRNFTTEISTKTHPKSWTNIKNKPHKDTLPYIVLAYIKVTFFVIRRVRRHISSMIHFCSFPNYHIRTNAFMISGEMMKALKYPAMKTKLDAYKFESGRKGLTRQILNKGKKVLVVGKDGVGYEKEAWNTSKTLWLFDQENLLISDNQTRNYQKGTAEKRQYLSSIAFGKK